MKKRLGVLMCFLLFMGSAVHSVGAQSNSPKGEKVSVNFMSYNIHHGVGIDNILDLERIAGLIRDEGADIVAIQEVDRHYGARSDFEDQAKKLAELLGYHYVYAANLDLDPLEEGAERRQYGTAVLSKYPIIQAENYLLPSFGKEQRGLLEATVNVKGNHIRVYNTHLGLTVSQRLAQVEEINKIVSAKKTPAVLMGDLNAEPDSDEVKQLLNGANLVDAFENRDNADTFPVENPIKRIDYIFASEGLKIFNQEVIYSTYSDHLPVIAEIELERTAPYNNGN
ncbi:endonuclease/exonuclease/phosphatase family protein [Bacillus sp. B-jedd]|uniref:endonuclease/exonuclease/phosphatase family protein n=1 Tax=Bacillus sp. B-jedd TaxID=1476857 RepID=UPI0005156985|nr:endonuclease/exonuclease/phosphatase family protein [Bacillus sp. B-jedd]CEG26272.1 endonuclease/exonuclease/phosphatase [Bacillus sp. B-jedd]